MNCLRFPYGVRFALMAALVSLGMQAFPSARASSIENCLSEKEFIGLANRLAPKVGLFREIWNQSPSAEFYGGTTRDYLYWILRQFQGTSSPELCRETLAKLERTPLIDAREFMHGDSDVDVVLPEREAIKVRPEDYGIRKIDTLSADIFDPKTEAGFNEFNQGYVPAEKIRLAAKGLRAVSGFADGASELYSGKLTVRFAPPELFWKTAYAARKENHPILLALRYLRILSQDGYQRHGVESVDQPVIPGDVEERIRQILDEALDGKSLRPFLENPRFASWLNGSIAKSFRTNPTLTRSLLLKFRVNELVHLYSQVKGFNSYLFYHRPDSKKIAQNFATLGFRPQDVFIEVSQEFPDRKLYHGTKTDEAFKSILLESVVPSTNGTAGMGVYGVSHKNLKFAVNWGGGSDFVVSFELKPDTRLIDIRTGLGQKFWDAYRQSGAFPGEKNEETFAEAFGIDLIKYPYQTEVYVLKNSRAIGGIQGLTRTIIPLSEILHRATLIKEVMDFRSLLRQFLLFPRTATEVGIFIDALPPANSLMETLASIGNFEDTHLILSNRSFREVAFNRYPKAAEICVKHLVDELGSDRDFSQIRSTLSLIKSTELGKRFNAADVDRVFQSEKFLKFLGETKEVERAEEVFPGFRKRFNQYVEGQVGGIRSFADLKRLTKVYFSYPRTLTEVDSFFSKSTGVQKVLHGFEKRKRPLNAPFIIEKGMEDGLKAWMIRSSPVLNHEAAEWIVSRVKSIQDSSELGALQYWKSNTTRLMIRLDVKQSQALLDEMGPRMQSLFKEGRQLEKLFEFFDFETQLRLARLWRKATPPKARYGNSGFDILLGRILDSRQIQNLRKEEVRVLAEAAVVDQFTYRFDEGLVDVPNPSEISLTLRSMYLDHHRNLAGLSAMNGSVTKILLAAELLNNRDFPVREVEKALIHKLDLRSDSALEKAYRKFLRPFPELDLDTLPIRLAEEIPSLRVRGKAIYDDEIVYALESSSLTDMMQKDFDDRRFQSALIQHLQQTPAEDRFLVAERFFALAQELKEKNFYTSRTFKFSMDVISSWVKTRFTSIPQKAGSVDPFLEAYIRFTSGFHLLHAIQLEKIGNASGSMKFKEWYFYLEYFANHPEIRSQRLGDPIVMSLRALKDDYRPTSITGVLPLSEVGELRFRTNWALLKIEALAEMQRPSREALQDVLDHLTKTKVPWNSITLSYVMSIFKRERIRPSPAQLDAIFAKNPNISTSQRAEIEAVFRGAPCPTLLKKVN